jgi:signal transduction histidine kinase
MTSRRRAGSTLEVPAELEEVARTLPLVLQRLRASYGELEERAARVELELKRAEREKDQLAERLHAADKLASLGTLAAGIAHEIRNPLNAVQGFAGLLLRSGQLADERAHRWAELIVAGVAEVDAIIANLLSFGRPEPLLLEPVEGVELLESAVRLAQSASGARDGAVRTRSDVPPFRADRIKLRQAVRNLVENALSAQESDARVELALEREGKELVFRVADAGPGVPAELRARILDPFFSTHPEGTGLGLSLVAMIARLHGGSVELAPEPSHLGGALFVLRIPYTPADSPAASPPTRCQP